MSVTPTKVCKRGRKAKEGYQNKNCRFCGTNFEAAGRRVSFQNLFSRTSQEETLGLILAECCGTIGLPVTKNPNLSERVCIPCSSKIKNAAELYRFVEETISATEDVSLRIVTKDSFQPPLRQRESRERSKSLKSAAMNETLLLERLIRGSPCFPKQEIIHNLIPRARKSPASAN